MRGTIVLVGTALLAAGCSAGGAPRVSLYEENDFFLPGGHTDHYYTQGLRLAAVFKAGDQPDLADALDFLPDHPAKPSGDDDAPRIARRIGWLFGQNMYTPDRIDSLSGPKKGDRPYAGWLYAGMLDATQSFADGDGDDARTGDVQVTKELDFGVVGPWSHAHQSQVWFHKVKGVDRPLGWKTQLPDEPGLDFVYDWRRRCVSLSAAERFGADVIPAGLVSLGTIDTHAEVGGTARVGWELPRDFGVSTIQTTAVEGEVGPPDKAKFSAYLFGGVAGRAVLRNEFLDGNLFRSYALGVAKRRFVGEYRWGLALEYGKFHVAYTVIERTKEFEGQRIPEKWGSIQIGFSADF